jgi:hypothetical protein
MKGTTAKAKKFESKKSLDGPMKFLKGNVSKVTKSLPKKKK